MRNQNNEEKKSLNKCIQNTSLLWYSLLFLVYELRKSFDGAHIKGNWLNNGVVHIAHTSHEVTKCSADITQRRNKPKPHAVESV